MKLLTLCQLYLEENFWLADSTQETTRRAFRYFADIVGNRQISRLCREDGERYKAWLIKTGRSQTTANIYLRSLSPVFNWAVDIKKLINENPVARIRQFRTPRKPIKVYEDWEVDRMIRYAPDLRWRTILVMARTTGMRRGEILNLTLNNIRSGFVHVEPKNNTNDTWPWMPKDKECRRIPLVPIVAEMIRELGSQLYPMLSKRNYENLLRLHRVGLLKGRQRKCPDGNFNRTFRTIQRQAFGRTIGDFHSLRKTFTTRMCEELPDHFVMRLTGHNSLKTMTYYLGVRQSYYQKALEVASNAIKTGLQACISPIKKRYNTDNPKQRHWAVLDLNQ